MKFSQWFTDHVPDGSEADSTPDYVTVLGGVFVLVTFIVALSELPWWARLGLPVAFAAGFLWVLAREGAL